MGFLYVIGCHGMTKIGITTNLERRMRELRPHFIYQVFMSLEHEVLERDAHELHADKRLPQSEWFNLNKDDREELFGFLRDRSVSLTKQQNQEMVSEDMKDKVQDSVESKKMPEERNRIVEERVKSLEATVKQQARKLAVVQEQRESFRGAVEEKTEALKAAEERIRRLAATSINAASEQRADVAEEQARSLAAAVVRANERAKEAEERREKGQKEVQKLFPSCLIISFFLGAVLGGLAF